MSVSPAFGPRLVLFGRSGAGKSALLGALSQAATQASSLFKGRLADDTGALAGLARGTYADALKHTSTEVAAYPLHFEPREGDGGAWSATLFDCDGAIAQEYLVGTRPLEDGQGLARALLSADTLILVVDAAAAPAQLEQDFTHFGAFLHLLQAVRGKRADIAGLPVYLVLAKCDLLAKPGDSRSAWVQRIEEGKRRIGQKFHDFLSHQATPPAFGAVRLHLWATAARRPALAEAAARPEPYGVAELFRQCLVSAESYRQRRDRAGQRLSVTVMGMAGVMAACALGMALLLWFEPSRALLSLEEQLAGLVPGQGGPAPERLRGAPALLEDRLQSLRKLQREPEYAHVPGSLRDAAEQYARELGAYLQAYQEYQKTIKLPHLARNAEELARYEKGLDEFALPPEYAEAWRDTRLARRLREVRQEYAALHRAEEAEIAWMHEQIKETRRLREQGNKFSAEMDAKPPPVELADWLRAVETQLQPHVRFPKGEPIPGVSGLTYEKLDHLPAVRRARAEWTSAQAVLRALADELRGRKEATRSE
jgi:hypothetical protein